MIVKFLPLLLKRMEERIGGMGFVCQKMFFIYYKDALFYENEMYFFIHYNRISYFIYFKSCANCRTFNTKNCKLCWCLLDLNTWFLSALLQ